MRLRERAPGRVKDAGRAAAEALGRASAPMRMLPRFLIVGAQRCGTTSLYRILARHPQVVAPAFHKGVHYFDTAERYRRGLSWYQGHFPVRALADRRALGGPAVTGEASPYYVFHPLAPARIAQALPGVRLVLLLRDPVERAFSAHKQETHRGFETEPFERALELEDSRLAGEEERMLADPGYQSFAHQHHAYRRRGQYADQVARLYELFGRDRVHVAMTDELFAADGERWDALVRFLGIAPWRPERMQRANARPSAPMAASVRAQLEASFTASDEALTTLLGEVPAWRR
ncbi:MAG: sulfotransferase [Actinomycetota bacterium]|nr:sulfotransferase [Actinomycetota bacterium]